MHMLPMWGSIFARAHLPLFTCNTRTCNQQTRVLQSFRLKIHAENFPLFCSPDNTFKFCMYFVQQF